MKTIFLLIALAFSLNLMAQDDSTESRMNRRGFDKSKLFTGGSVTFSLSNNTTVLGVIPTFGYSLTKWLDAGILLNFMYASQRDPVAQSGNVLYIIPGKLRQNIVGPGAFVRVYPVNFLFAQAQFEKNFIRYKFIPNTNGRDVQIERFKPESFLVGAGYCQGREGSGETFFYLSLMFDIAKNPNSPYVEQSVGGSINVLPIIRGGIQIPLFR